MQTMRCEVKLRDAQKRVERWRRIAMEATKQSGRAAIMKVAEPRSFEDVLASADQASAVLFSEREGKDMGGLRPSDEITAFIGPKGGWDDAELEAARSKRLPIVTLGGRILRAETAAISLCAILQHRFGDLN